MKNPRFSHTLPRAASYRLARKWSAACAAFVLLIGASCAGDQPAPAQEQAKEQEQEQASADPPKQEKQAENKKQDHAKGKPNRLAKETSPYLLMHARNPVDWFPWGPEALAKAKKGDVTDAIISTQRQKCELH